MKLWILGAKGLLGSTLANLCFKKNLPFVATNREESDLSDLGSLRRFAQKSCPTHIINCAGFTNVDLAETQSLALHEANVLGPQNLSLIAKENNAKLMHISTDYVFDGKGKSPYSETDFCQPLGAYGKSKREGELKILSVSPSFCILRTSWLFGKGGKNFISALLNLMQMREELKVACDQRGRPTYSWDLSQAILDLLPYEGIFHFANSSELSRFEMAKDLYELARSRNIPLKCRSIVPALSTDFPTAAPRPSYSVLSTKKFENTTGKTPREWKEVLGEYLKDMEK